MIRLQMMEPLYMVRLILFLQVQSIYVQVQVQMKVLTESGGENVDDLKYIYSTIAIELIMSDDEMYMRN